MRSWLKIPRSPLRRGAALLCVVLTLADNAMGENLATPVDPAVWRRAMELSGLELTDAPGRIRILVFFDADCPYCATLWSRLHAQATTRGVKWIPVAYFGTGSYGRAASLLSAREPGAALDANFRTYDRAKNAGAARVMDNVPGPIAGRIQANETFWKGLGAMTPLIIYRSRNGTSYSFSGMPDEVAFGRMLADLAPSSIARYEQADAKSEEERQ
jgi:thiol:disulfide interchange protein DsbG